MRTFLVSFAVLIPAASPTFVSSEISTDGGMTSATIARAKADCASRMWQPPDRVVPLSIIELED